MPDLLSLLSLGSAGMAAQNAGVSIATNNVANANTQGYSRQRVDLESLLGAPLVGGVRSGAPDRLQDNLLAGRIRNAAGSLAGSRAFSQAMLDLEQRVSGGAATIHDQLGTLFGKLGAVAATPTDATARTSAVASARELASGIRGRALELDAARGEANIKIREDAASATTLAKRLADSNAAVARTNDPVIRDERDRIAAQLSELVGGAARIDGDGKMRFVLDGGGVLVDGDQAAQLAVTPGTTSPVSGQPDLQVELVSGSVRRDVTQSLGGGRLGANLAARDGAIATARSELDQLAFDVTTSFNAVHTANAGLDGVTGRAMFAPLAGVAGAASAIAIDATLDADPSVLATAAPGAGPGDNRGALALFGLASQPVATGGKTLTGSALDLVSRIGSQAAEATASVTRDELVGEHLAGLRDSLAGVDIQEELTNLARFEHASSAMTRFVSTIDNLLGDLIDRL
jgi:flagellar hook-associated protein 1 FlgK